MSPRVVVASHNPVKLAAVRRAFGRALPGRSLRYEAVTVASGVPRQPMGDAETLAGARERTAAARRLRPGHDFWVGIEGGVAPQGGALVALAWVVVEGRRGAGRARTASFVLPPAVAALVRAGHELGTADDLVFGRRGSKRRGGAVGLLTGDLIDRTGLYEPAVVLALVPFLQPELYPGGAAG